MLPPVEKGRFVRRGSWIVSAAVAGLVLAGCGGGAEQAGEDGDGDVVIEEQARLFDAAASTLDAGSARIAMEMRIDGGEGTELEELSHVPFMSAEGVQDFDTGDGSMTLDMSAIATLAGGAPGVDPSDLTFEVRTVGGVLYMRMGALLGPLAPTEWLSMDLEAVVRDLGLGDASIAQLQQQSDPSGYVEMLAAVSDDVRQVGEEEVRGVQTTRYGATVDFARLPKHGLRQLPPELREQLEEDASVEDLFGAFGETFGEVAFPIDVWVDGDDLLRRMTMELDLSAFAGGLGAGDQLPPGLSFSMTMEYFDYGVQVDVEAPPADDVTDFADVIGAPGALSPYGSPS